MSSVVLFSAKGAPGVTTTAMLLASLWERPAVLADCDPAGGDVALRLPDPDGRQLDVNRGMLSLLSVARRSIDDESLSQHAQPVLGGGLVLAGLAGPEQAAAAGPVWRNVAAAFGQLETLDVVVDVGRLDGRSAVLPLVAQASLAVCVVQASLPGVYAARARLRALLGELGAGSPSPAAGPRFGVVVRAAARRQADEAAGALAEEFPQLEYLGHVADDPTGARIFDGQPVSRPERTLLVRSGGELVATIGGVLYTVDWARPATTGDDTSDEQTDGDVTGRSVLAGAAGNAEPQRVSRADRRRAERESAGRHPWRRAARRDT